ncbi:leucine-rich repeat protein, partial [Companilactobacillus muriivasis]|uniref:leucine-rich repeat protein n=1 Tax=Companilactobacillus muriivasis TaxID=3081444 RepID=UPI0030C77918
MRFQQLKRDPNSVMRKKLVKSKKAWVVVSSLSIAGGLLMMTAPSYVAKAEVTSGTPDVKTVLTSTTPPSSTGTTSQNSSKQTAPATSAPTKPVAPGSKTAETPATKQVPVENNTEVKDTEVTTDSTKESAPETTPKETTPAIVENPTVKDAPVEAPSTETVTPTPAVAALSAAAPTAGTEQETTVPDGSTDEKTVVAPADPETPVTGDSVTDVKTPLDVSTITDSKLMSLMVPADANVLNANLTDLAADTNVLATPVAEVATVPVPDVDDKGTGWTYTSASKNLDINGPLTDFKAGDTDHWNGHASTITNITVSAPVTAPTDSSYMFANMPSLNSVNIDNLNMSDVHNTQGMFKNDSNLTALDFSKVSFTLDNNISHMFENDTKLATIKFGGLNNTTSERTGDVFRSLVNGSYAFANCISLTQLLSPNNDRTTGDNISSTNAWIVSSDFYTYPGTRDLRGMFKNDSSLNTIYITTWAWPAGTITGDSFKGEGMFDGTNLQSIKINSSLKFDSNTALTSNKGINWTESTYNQHFSGIPKYDDNNNLTDGLGFLYNGNADFHIKGSQNDEGRSTPISLLYIANGVPDANTVVTNLVTIHTTHDGITSDITAKATGTYGSSVKVDVPESYPFDPNKPDYTTTVEKVNATLGFTQTAATEIVPYSLEAAQSGSVKVSTSNGSIINIPVTATDTDTVGTTTSTTITNDQIKTLVPGYHLANDADSTSVDVTFISPTTTDPTIVGTSTSSIDLVGDDIAENTSGSVTTKQSTAKDAPNTPVTVTVPAGSIGSPSQPIDINVPGYKPTSVIATTNVVDGKNVVTYTTNDGNKTVIDSEHPLQLIGNNTDEDVNGSVLTKQSTAKDAPNTPVTVTVPAGSIGSPSQPIDINVPGYK